MAALYGILGTVLAALISAFFGFLSMEISKENKTSEFRQAWLLALRQDVADYVGAVKAFLQYKEEWTNTVEASQQELEYTKILAPFFTAVTNAQTRIRLRVAAVDEDRLSADDHAQLLRTLDQIRTLANDGKKDEAEQLIDALHTQVVPLLKREWQLVRRGEPGYIRLKKWMVIALGLLAFLVAGLVLCLLAKA